MKLVDVTNREKNEVILEALTEQGIEVDATPVVIDIVSTGKEDDNGNEWLMVFLMAEIKLKSNNTTLSKAQLALKGWGTNSMVLRSMEAIPSNVVADMEIEKGSKLEDMTFRVIDTTEKPFDTAKPRITRNKELLYTEEGEVVYRETQVVTVDELNEENGGHQTIKCSVKKSSQASGTAPSAANAAPKQEVLNS